MEKQKQKQQKTPVYPFTPLLQETYRLLSRIGIGSIPAAAVEEFGYFAPKIINLILTKHLFSKDFILFPV